MSDLSPKETDLLERISRKPELEPYFFRKAKDLKWFDELEKRGYFDPSKNPEPVPADQDGHYRVPTWNTITYLVNIAPKLHESQNTIYAKKTVAFIWAVSDGAIKRGISNYRTWWKFSLILCQIPPEFIIETDIIEYIPYWLNDRFCSDLAGKELGEVWLPRLLDTNNAHSRKLAFALVQVLYQVNFVKTDVMGSSRENVQFPIKEYHLSKITQNIRQIAKVIGLPAVEHFIQNLRLAIDRMGNDPYSSIWRPAVEDHKQNEYKDDELEILLVCVRDSLSEFLVSDFDSAQSIICTLLEDQLQTLRRIGIYLVDANYANLKHLSGKVINTENFSTNMRHEVWHFLKNHYNALTSDQKGQVLDTIKDVERQDDDGNLHPGFTAYAQSVWLSAIQNHDPLLKQRYQEQIDMAGAEPDHPDFSSYMSTGGFRGTESPLSQDEILSMAIDDLIHFLNGYKTKDAFDGPSVEGLASTLTEAVQNNPLLYIRNLDAFKKTKISYIHALIVGYGEAWEAKQDLPWTDIWDRLLDFFLDLIESEDFWLEDSDTTSGSIRPNHKWLVKSMAQLLGKGVKNDGWAFDRRLMPKAKRLLLELLEKQNGSDSFQEGRDAVSIAINSARGNLLEALINFGLRSCRLSDQDAGNHESIWNELKPLFDRELDNKSAQGYEFITLVTRYLRNFMYMSMEWTKKKLPEMFDHSDNLWWSCAMTGVASIGTLHDDIYCYLRDHGDLIQVLEQEGLMDYVRERSVQNMGIGYLRGLEDLGNPQSMISQLLIRRKDDELGILISFLSPFKEKLDPVIREKSLALWPMILESLDKKESESRKQLSRLCQWLGYVETIDDTNRHLIYETIKFVGDDYNAFDTLEQIARLSRTQPIEAGKLWLEMLKYSSEDYPKDAIQEALQNLMSYDRDGRRLAEDICSEYLKFGTERPHEWRKEILVQGISAESSSQI